MTRNMFFVIFLSSVMSVSSSELTSSCRKFDCEYKLMAKLIHLEEKTSRQESKINHLSGKLEEAEQTIIKLNDTIHTNQKSADGTTYIRWGRTTCPRKAVLVYDGYVGGSHYTHSGSGSNPLCLPKNPDYEKYTEGFQNAARIYGAEYETNTYPKWNYLHDHDIPCAVCRIPRNNVLMIPGKNKCHEDYKLEYKGYLMAEYYKHASSSEFVCVDEHPETIKGTHANRNGKLFFFVEGECGSLRCNPYKQGWELTCAVCSYSSKAKSTSVRPYS